MSESKTTECIAAIDQGTQSTRCCLFGRNAEVIGSHQVEFTQYYPRAGWTEHDASEIWRTVQTCIEGALSDAKTKVGQVRVKAVGITNQRETTLAWDRATGQPLHKAVVWLCGRTAETCKRMTAELGSQDYFRDVTGLPISTYFSAYKVRWLLENSAEVRQAADEGRCMFGTIDSWLIYNLTGGVDGGAYVTDVSNASRTNLMELATLRWHEPTLKLFGITADMLPEIRSNAEEYGRVKSGPLAGVPIAGCLGDQQAAMLGQRCRPGEAKNTYGTGCFLLLNTGLTPVPSRHGLLTTLAFQLGRDAEVHYALEGAIAIAGAGISWLRDQLGILSSAAESGELAASVPDTGGVYFVPAFSGLLAPHWRSDARGALLGISGFTTKAHVTRAMLEAICWQTREVVDAMRLDADLSRLALLRVDGGATANELLLQLQADVLQVPVLRPGHLETTSLGAAFAAGIAVGFWSREWVFGEVQLGDGDTTFQPSAPPEEVEARYSHWKKAVQLSFGLAELAG